MANTPKRPNGEQTPQDKAQKKQEKARKRAAKKENRRWYWTTLKYGSMTVGGLIVLGIGAGTGYAASLLKGLPTISASTFSNLSQSSVVLASDGKTVIGRFDAQGNRDPISNLNQVSPHLTNAFVAAEDKTFWTNIGINPMAMGRAVIQDLVHHHIESGASTITQQTVKLAVFPEQQRTGKRKIQEIALSLKLNHILTKQEIMVDYMNWVYFGHLGNNPVYGVKAASKILFGKDPKDLNLAESALLASIPNNASLYDPYEYDDKTKSWKVNVTTVKQRQHYILQQLLKNGTITQQQYTDAMNFDIAKDIKKPTESSTNTKYPYLMQDEIPFLVEQDLVKAGVYSSTQQADAALSTGGYKIYTTINVDDQKLVNSVLEDPKWYNGMNKTVNNKVDRFEAGFTLIDNQTGQILAIGGGNGKNSIDHSDIPRQPGSSMKPLVDYGPGLELHKITAASPLRDAPIPWYGKGHAHDDEAGWRGIVTARKALVESYNIPAIELLKNLGVQSGQSFLPKMGITNNSLTITGRRTWVEKPIKVKNPTTGKWEWVSDVNLSSAIGGLTYGLTVQQMTSAYTTFANEGVWKSPYMIAKITDSTGKTVYQNKQTVNRVFTPQTVYVLDSILRDVVTKGTASLIGSHFGSDFIYGKTGTSDQEHDGWFIGFTKKYTAGIWEGYDIPEKIQPGNPYNEKFYMWNAIMSSLVKNSDHSAFSEPTGIVHATVCTESGMLPNALCKQAGATESELFIAGTEPTKTGNVFVQLPYVVVNGKKYLATTNTPAAEIQIGVFLNPPWKITPDDMKANDSSKYAPQQPDPRGGTVLPPLSSNSIAKPPAAPTGLQAALNGGGVQLSWAPVQGATGYTVWRSTSANGTFTKLTPSPITTPSFTDAAVPPNTPTVYYEVFAVSTTTGSSTPSTIPVPVQQGGTPPTGSAPPTGTTGNSAGGQ